MWWWCVFAGTKPRSLRHCAGRVGPLQAPRGAPRASRVLRRPPLHHGERCQGVEIIVSGKLRAQRAKAMKFKDGYMVRCGVVWTAAFVSSAYFSRDWLRYNEP